MLELLIERLPTDLALQYLRRLDSAVESFARVYVCSGLDSVDDDATVYEVKLCGAFFVLSLALSLVVACVWRANRDILAEIYFQPQNFEIKAEKVAPTFGGASAEPGPSEEEEVAAAQGDGSAAPERAAAAAAAAKSRHGGGAPASGAEPERVQRRGWPADAAEAAPQPLQSSSLPSSGRHTPSLQLHTRYSPRARRGSATGEDSVRLRARDADAQLEQHDAAAAESDAHGEFERSAKLGSAVPAAALAARHHAVSGAGATDGPEELRSAQSASIRPPGLGAAALRSPRGVGAAEASQRAQGGAAADITATDSGRANAQRVTPAGGAPGSPAAPDVGSPGTPGSPAARSQQRPEPSAAAGQRGSPATAKPRPVIHHAPSLSNIMANLETPTWQMLEVLRATTAAALAPGMQGSRGERQRPPSRQHQRQHGAAAPAQRQGGDEAGSDAATPDSSSPESGHGGRPDASFHFESSSAAATSEDVAHAAARAATLRGEYGQRIHAPEGHARGAAAGGSASGGRHDGVGDWERDRSRSDSGAEDARHRHAAHASGFALPDESEGAVWEYSGGDASAGADGAGARSTRSRDSSPPHPQLRRAPLSAHAEEPEVDSASESSERTRARWEASAGAADPAAREQQLQRAGSHAEAAPLLPVQPQQARAVGGARDNRSPPRTVTLHGARVDAGGGAGAGEEGFRGAAQAVDEPLSRSPVSPGQITSRYRRPPIPSELLAAGPGLAARSAGISSHTSPPSKAAGATHTASHAAGGRSRHALPLHAATAREPTRRPSDGEGQTQHVEESQDSARSDASLGSLGDALTGQVRARPSAVLPASLVAARYIGPSAAANADSASHVRALGVLLSSPDGAASLSSPSPTLMLAPAAALRRAESATEFPGI